MKILDKNSDFYDYLSFSEFADDELTFDRRGSFCPSRDELLARCAGQTKYRRDEEFHGKNWKRYRRLQENPFYELILVAGTEFFVLELLDLKFEERTDESGRKTSECVNFTPVLVESRKNYGVDLGILRLYFAEAEWYDRRARRKHSAWGGGSERSWKSANLANARFSAVFKGEDGKADERIPILLPLGISQVLPAERVYSGIEEYLFSKREEKPRESRNLDDRGKILNHGFDTRTSFRNCR